MIQWQGTKIKLSEVEPGIVQLCFDATDGSVNKFDQNTFLDLLKAIAVIEKNISSIKGLLITSNKEHFIVGADILEFSAAFKQTPAELETWLLRCDETFNKIEDFPFPSVAVIAGSALGGGFELALTASYRVAGQKAMIGLPETKLGIYPGWGGTIRLSRLAGLDNALEWILLGSQNKATVGYAIGAVDAVVEESQLQTAGLSMLKSAIQGDFKWQKRAAEKKGPVELNAIEQGMVLSGAKAMALASGGKQMPHLMKAIEAIENGVNLNREAAQKIEAQGFAAVAGKPEAQALVGVFLGSQALKKQGKASEGARPVKKAAVLGAGIMGGGIAMQSASTGFPILMKDVNSDSLDKGMKEAISLFEKQVGRKKLTVTAMANAVCSIVPTLDYHGFDQVDFVIEAVVENTGVKKKVLAEVEGLLPADAVLASNTSSILITELASGLKRPENFCGMHFFNPVNRMPLVEIIRGKSTSASTIDRAVKYAVAMGKTPIVVNDCGGFLVNRVLFPYLIGFLKLLDDKVSFTRIDKVMEKFGFPMGPAYLSDVIGLDTSIHALGVMSAVYPDRMNYKVEGLLKGLFDQKKFGQKTGKGFYVYSVDKKGKPVKKPDPELQALLEESSLTDAQIVDRMMVPMILESARCLEDKIVNTAMEVDMGQILGLGFPPFRGGALRFADALGLDVVSKKAETFASLGPLYHQPELMKKMRVEKKNFYS